MTVESSKKDYFFDNRISQRHIRQGRLEREEFEEYLASLPDLVDVCEDIGEEIYGSEQHNSHEDHEHEDEG